MGKKIIITDRYIPTTDMTKGMEMISGPVFARIPKTADAFWENVALVTTGQVYVNRKPRKLDPKKYDAYLDLVISMILATRGADIFVAFSYTRHGELCASVLEKQIRLRGVKANLFRVPMFNPMGAIGFGNFLSGEETDREVLRIWYNQAFMFDITPQDTLRLPMRKAVMIRNLFNYQHKTVPNLNPDGASATTALVKANYGEMK